MASTRLALQLTVTLLGIVMARATVLAQESAPQSTPDPAAVLLPPVPTTRLRAQPSIADYDLPARPSERIRPVQALRSPAAALDSTARIIDAKQFEQLERREALYPPEDTAKITDPYDYLMGDSFRRESRQLGDSFGDGYVDEPGFADQLQDRMDQLFGDNGGLFAQDNDRRFISDHAFDGFISPVTNPFYFEDPRSLTELRPIAIFQKIPDGQPLFQGGNALFFGTQARLALTKRWSFVINKIGFQSFNPAGSSVLEDDFGLSELHLGPKVTLIRDPEFQTLVAAGTTFQIPLGSADVYQDTGSLSIVPYVSAAQRLMSTRLGTLNGMATAGYAFSTDRQRSDFFFTSAHIDLNLSNRGRFYPFMEANWFVYTTDGESRDFGVEGRDLANFGANAEGSNLLTFAFGAKFKPRSNRFEFGGAFELPFIGNRDLFDYRFTLDFIWRY